MTSVFKLEPDYDAHGNSPWHWLNSDADLFAWDFLARAVPQRHRWIPLPVTLMRENALGDFLYLTAGSGFVASAKAIEVIAPLLSDTVEFLPVACGQSDKLFVMHILRHVDLGANARTNQKSSNKNVTVVHDYDFKSQAINGLHLFMVRQPLGCPAGDGGFATHSIFASSEFRTVVESSQLRGLSFREFPVA